MREMPTLSVVMPVYNEPYWVGVSVADVTAAIERSAFRDVELIVVDDGSNHQTREALVRLQTPFPLQIVHEDNKGRFLARREGVRLAHGDLVLLLDSRVSLDEDSLAFICRHFEESQELSVWTGYGYMDCRGNPYARFWNVLTEVAYRDYCANPRTMSFGVEDFDRYPKGTTSFIAPRASLLDAMERFESLYLDLRNANDDTGLIRVLAEQWPINISPHFACLYRSRESLRPFMRHAFHRGGVFVDGWARVGGRFFGVIVAFYPLSALAVALGVRRPRLALRAALTTPLASAGAGAALRRPPADCVALALLGVPWLCAYAAGMWRGLWLAALGRAAGSRRVVGTRRAAGTQRDAGVGYGTNAT